MSRYEYFCMKVELFPDDIIKEYGLCNKVDIKGDIHCKVRRGMYGLPQAGIIPQDLLKEGLLKAGYKQSKITPGYWTHLWRPINFALVVDNFKVQHLINTLKQDYKIKEDWDGHRYLGITLDWDYKKQEVHLSMLGYVNKALARLGHEPPTQPKNQPHKHTIPTYGATVQYAKDEDTTKRLTTDDKNYIQQVLGTFLYFGHAVNSTMLTALSSIASAQAKPTEATMANVKHFLDYAATHQNAVLRYHASNMVLVIHSDASYLSKPKACSRAGSHFFIVRIATICDLEF